MNEFLGDETIDAVVHDVSKSNSPLDKLSFDSSGSIAVEPTSDILSPYEVAVVSDATNEEMILDNNNTPLRGKFNKRAIQLQLEPGKKYRFYVHRLVFGKNIVSVEDL